MEQTDARNGTQKMYVERTTQEIHGGPGAGGLHATRRLGAHEAGGWMGEPRRKIAPPQAAIHEQLEHGQTVAMLTRGDDPVGKEAAHISEEGRGDPTSTMLWSPDKIIGSKQALEECAGSADESEGGSRDGEGN